MFWAYLALFVVLGMAVDWAIFEQAKASINAFWPVKEGFGYRDLLFPRAWLTIISTLIVGFGGLQAPPHIWLIAIGGGLFLLSQFYAQYRIWRFGRRR